MNCIYLKFSILFVIIIFIIHFLYPNKQTSNLSAYNICLYRTRLVRVSALNLCYRKNISYSFLRSYVSIIKVFPNSVKPCTTAFYSNKHRQLCLSKK